MKFPVTYNTESMTLHVHVGKYDKFLQCPFATWWKARKYFKRPRFKFYFGPMWKYKGKVQAEFGDYDDYEYLGGYWPAASTDYLRWYTPRWFPIHVMSWDIGWKDKYNTPRYERHGHFIVFFGRDYHRHWQFSMVVTAPEFFCNNDCTIKDHEDNYWESMLWYLNYADKYDTKDKKRNIVTARDTMNVYHWSRSKQIKLDDLEVVDMGTDIINMGGHDEHEYTYFDVRSTKLNDVISKTREYAKDTLISSVCVYVDIDLEKEKNIFTSSKYVKVIATDDEHEDTVRIYYVDEDRKILLNHVADFVSGDDDFIKFMVSEHIDLGPSFKDDYLTRRALDEIKRYHDGVDVQ